MQRLQQWFERLAGYSAEDIARWQQIREIYENNGSACAGPNLAQLHKPACWRRGQRLGVSRRG